MKEDWQLEKCFVCGPEYLQSSIKPFNYKVNNEWKTVKQLQYKNKKLPLCNEHFRMYMLSYIIERAYDLPESIYEPYTDIDIDIDGEHINE